MVETPYIIIDELTMKRNITRMAEKVALHGVSLRPHIKTHKMPELAKLQLQAGASGITVAKVGEAEIMSAAGVQDIFIAYPLVVRSKIERAAALMDKSRIVFAVDSIEGGSILSEIALSLNRVLEVRLEIDLGLKRTGVLYEEAEQLALKLHELEGIKLTGIFTYRGSMLSGQPTMDTKAAGLEEGTLMAALAARLRELQLDIRDVSVGSTPTGEYAAQVQGVTEIRPGTYIFNDRMQETIGACSAEDCAASVQVTVVSVRKDGLVIVDGGSKTFATDVQPGGLLGMVGFGKVIGHPEAVFERMNEEHGILRFPEPAKAVAGSEAGAGAGTGTEAEVGATGTGKGAMSFSIGDTLQIVPNHICSTVNLHNAVYLKRGDQLEKLVVSARGALT
ncbi:alanine racemase [Paenibacillus eucommiae]|uniref:D-serine deaminase-like pyridoxal phosphate-dependent protein n=1 Tax=Paenibacillus eucommiae TaxID=1355755 RepID=A0ABS4IZY7_9BACL|nr:alanine racemase [Paenibacillus eucommiae]MBP1993153.1 D-serine deaminase-like pyridoxal phosphate-dependent protein [Paenibacillus eucommiae]